VGVLDVPYNRNVNVNNLENPFATAEGQQVVSTSENFWARLNRIGRPRSVTKNYSQFTLSGYGTYGTQYNMTGSAVTKFPSLGHVFYPQCITVSTTCDAEVWIAVYQPTVDNTSNFVDQGGFIKANTPFQWYPDGSVMLTSGDSSGYDGSIVIRVTAKTTTPTTDNYFRANVTGIEIARGDV